MSNTWYLDPSGGSNANSGTSMAFPWRTLAYAASNSADGDVIVCIGGRFGSLASDVFVKSCNNLRLVAYSQSSPPIVSSGRYATSWTLDSGNCWYASIGTGKNVAGVGIKWGLLVDGSGRNTSDAAIAASVVACRAASNSYYYDSGAGRLYVNFAGANPNTDTDILAYPTQWFEGGIQSLVALTGTGNSIEGFCFENQRDLTADSFAAICYGSDNTIQGCRAYNMTWHAFAMVGSGGAANTGCVIQQNECWGGGNINTGASRGNAVMIANYADSGSGLNLSTCRVRQNIVRCYAPLLVAGTPASAAAQDGFFHHCGTGAYVSDIEYRDNDVYHYENLGNGFTGGDTLQAAIPADSGSAELEPSNYPVRLYDCRHYGGYSNGYIDGAAMVRCLLSMTGQMTSGNGNFTLPSATAKLCLDACHVAADLYSASGYRSIFELVRTDANKSRLVMKNTNLLDVASSTPNWNRGFTFNGSADDTAYIRAYGCCFSSRHAKALTLVYGDNGMSHARLGFVGCYYHNIENGSGGYYSEDATRRTRALWQANVDPVTPAVYDTDPQFVAASTSAVPTAGGNLDTAQLRQSVHSGTGINERPYGGQYGAQQKGGGGAGGLIAAGFFDN